MTTFKNQPDQPESENKLPAKQKSLGSRFVHAWIPCKGDGVKEGLRKIFLLIAIIVFIVSTVMVGMKYYKTYENQKKNETLNNMVTEDGLTWDKVRAMYPNINFPEGMQLKYALAYAKNQDLVGWLSVDGTSMQVPIVKGKDNAYYLTKDFYKNSTEYGNPFMDFQNNIRPLDFNTVIYGHNMRDKQQFGQLADMYDTIEHYKQYPVIQYNTIFQDYQWLVVGAFLTNGHAAQDNDYIFQFNTTTMGPFSRSRFIQEMKQRMIYNTGVYWDEQDTLLTLTTCSYVFTEARLAVVARLAKEGDATPDTAKATLNENPRYPQAWYAKNKQKNPFPYDFWQPDNT